MWHTFNPCSWHTRNQALVLIALVLLADQFLKIWIKTHFTLGEEISLLGKYGFLHFTENNGMAFGIEFFGDIGKLFLSLFRVVFIGFIAWFIRKQILEGASKGLILGLSAMFAGALGNLIDSLFYGILFGESTYTQVAQFLPDQGGYAQFLYGKVVDMFYFPIINTTLPSWLPFKGGDKFIFFRPIFNIADAAITTSVAYLMIFQRHFLAQSNSE
ncbi:MAG: lipoprotein signal peptidase [Bacteroidales bacterium]